MDKKLHRRGAEELARSLRPRRISEMWGNENAILLVKNILSKPVPQRTMLFTGDNGSGKTTMARIVRTYLVCENPNKEPGEPCLICPSCIASLAMEPGMRSDFRTDEELKSIVEEITKGLKGAAKEKAQESAIEMMKAKRGFLVTQELNGSNIGKDEAKEIIERFCLPDLFQSKAKVLIIDEAHLVTGAALQHLLKPMEDLQSNVWILMCTSDPRKIPKALRQRLTSIEMESLTQLEIQGLVEDVIQSGNLINMASHDPRDIARQFYGLGINTPREIVSQLESVNDGAPITKVAEEQKSQAYELTKAMLSRQTPVVLSLLNTISQSDVVPAHRMVISFMRSAILSASSRGSINERADKLLELFLSVDRIEERVDPYATFVSLVARSCRNT